MVVGFILLGVIGVGMFIGAIAYYARCVRKKNTQHQPRPQINLPANQIPTEYSNNAYSTGMTPLGPPISPSAPSSDMHPGSTDAPAYSNPIPSAPGPPMYEEESFQNEPPPSYASLYAVDNKAYDV